MQPVATAPRHHLALLVIAGGMVGSALRIGVVELIPANAFPWATLAVNLTGSLFVGWALPGLQARSRGQRRVAFVGIGVAAAYTTFATFVGDAVLLVEAERWSAAAGYAVLSVVGGAAGTVLGYLLGRRP
ncbi:MAG: CrcB family protein [Acidimicrobiia bacterium]